MRTLLLIALLSSLFFPGAEAQGADWKYYGEGDLSKGDAVIAYYDAESIKRLPDGSVRAWTQCISHAEVERIVNLEEVAKKAARKIKDGYVPPYMSSNPKPEPGYDVNMRIIGWEAAGNYDVIKPRLKVFYELNCTAKKIRNLSTINYNNDGGTKTSPESDTWVHVGPESNTESLYKILCNQRDVIK